MIHKAGIALLFALAVLAVPVTPAAASPAANDLALREAMPQLHDGDIIFIRIANPFFHLVSETCRSWESHVGIVFRDSNGHWMVAESKIPVSKFTPLERFVAHSEHHRFLVKRLRGGLADDTALRLGIAAKRRMGKLYDPGFKYDSSRLYCSKLVYDTYLESTGEEVGHLQTFRELLNANPSTPVGFWRLWFLGHIPWDRRCVTTTSELQSNKLVTVYDSEGGK